MKSIATREELRAHLHKLATLTRPTITESSQALHTLRKAIRFHEKDVLDGLFKDLHKSAEQAFVTEVMPVYNEFKYLLSHLREFRTPQTQSGSLMHPMATARIHRDPFGTCLIFCPWNYPFNLSMLPVISALAAGNRVLLIMSSKVPHLYNALEKIVSDCDMPELLTLIKPRAIPAEEILDERYDLIFYTGGRKFAREIMGAAAKHLTPVILELGGKSPCIISETADIALAAKRIAWGKTLNAGQTCIAPDYILIHEQLKWPFVRAFESALIEMFGKDIKKSKHFGRMITDAAYERVASYIDKAERCLIGGEHDAAQKFIAPTIIEASHDADAWQEEIFGPVLPLDTFTSLDEAIDRSIAIDNRPLALYFFGRRSEYRHVLSRTYSGSAACNDVMVQIAHPELPFGGVGESGMGRYHGRAGLEAFTYIRSSLASSTLVDPSLRYPPYKGIKTINKFI